jgi:hypothetical protein
LTPYGQVVYSVPLGRSYHFERHAIDAFDRLAVPIRRDQDGVFYEALFNRLRQEG